MIQDSTYYAGSSTDKAIEDPLFAFLYHEVCEDAAYMASLKLIEQELSEQLEWDRQESNHYENLLWERQVDAEAQEQLEYLERTGRLTKELKPFVPGYVPFVQRIEELLR